MLRFVLAVALAMATDVADAQFTLQRSGTNASLRGISSVDGRIAWASGSDGTILRTLDGGGSWTRCATPAGAEKLDFRAIQAFDKQTALAMSTGAGNLSRVYKTTDGGSSWKLTFTNPDAPEGFFDALQFSKRDEGWIMGDPVKGQFFLATTQDGGETWIQSKAAGLNTAASSGAFAASNQSLLLLPTGLIFGGGSGHLFRGVWPQCSQSTTYNDPGQCLDRIWFYAAMLPVGGAASTSGIFAIVAHDDTVVAVGGDYAAPESARQIAAVSTDGGVTWTASKTQPHGYRSSVAYDTERKAWIAVGPNGADISTDDGRTWAAMTPDRPGSDASDANRSWNALSLPFVVGANGRIAKLLRTQQLNPGE